MKNEIIKISSQEMSEILKEFRRDQSSYILELDGSKIYSWKDYIEIVAEKLEFPKINLYSKDGYIDWMTDLEWLEKESYIVIIYEYSKFMNENPCEKEEVIDMFRTNILPFWKEEVTHVTAGGYPKKFNVYLVD